jgi:dienelactone hydrolase
MIKTVNGDHCHDILTQERRGALAYREGTDYETWRQAVAEKLRALLGLDVIAENACPVVIDIEETVEFDSYKRIRLTYESERGNFVPAYLLIPKQGKERYPLAIALQGHTSGFHNSIGVIKSELDHLWQPVDCFGLQAVEHGFAALCIEQRGMGETRSRRYPSGGLHACSFTAMTAINLGRTIIGERVWDVSRGIDALEQLAFPEIDLSKIMIMGHSGGGTATFYAGCCEERIGYVVPSCSFCSYRASIMDILHCVCNNIPGASRWFEMEDLACLIAPRKLAIMTGKLDEIFPLSGVEASYETVKTIYQAAGVPMNCRMVIMPKAHNWCPDVTWPVICDDTKQLGW